MTVAVPMPPPTHNVASAVDLFVLSNSSRTVPSIIAPVAPRGCPIAIAIAMGHPLGATGAMILGTVLDELERTNKSTALATLCVGGGMGTATVIERV